MAKLVLTPGLLLDRCLAGARLLLVAQLLGALPLPAFGQASAPQPDPVDSNGVTVIGTHDDPPNLDHFDLLPGATPTYVWSKRGAYGLTNASSDTYFVPNLTTLEFDAFLANLPDGAAATPACWSATLLGVCAGGSLSAGTEASASCGEFACTAGQWRRAAATYQVITTSQPFVAPVTGQYRVLAVGGGLGGGRGSYDSGHGGSSGYVNYTTVNLTAGDVVTVRIGSNGSPLSGSRSGDATTFGSFLSAPGGSMVSIDDPGRTGGGSGGGSINGGAGGSCGSSGGTARCSGCPTDLVGLGQGSSFSQYLTQFRSVPLACGAGGPAGPLGSGNGVGGGGGGGVVVEGRSIGGLPNGYGEPQGGYGYGAGGAGGAPSSGGSRNTTPGSAIPGVLVIEW